MRLLQFEDEEARQILLSGGLLAFPTETVFGIGVRFDRKDSFDRLVRVKRRPATKPFTLMLASVAEIEKYAYLDEERRRVVETLLPGEVTVVLRKKETVPDFAALGGSTIGIRIPASSSLLAFLNRVGIPLLVPSANRSGEAPCRSAQEVVEAFGDDLDGVVEGKGGGGLPSTVVSLLDGEVKILREGRVSREEIVRALHPDPHSREEERHEKE